LKTGFKTIPPIEVIHNMQKGYPLSADDGKIVLGNKSGEFPTRNPPFLKET
jgi:hypothetical protein